MATVPIQNQCQNNMHGSGDKQTAWTSARKSKPSEGAVRELESDVVGPSESWEFLTTLDVS